MVSMIAACLGVYRMHIICPHEHRIYNNGLLIMHTLFILF